MSNHSRPILSILAAGGLACALIGCAPLRSVNGYQAIEAQPKEVKVGKDTKSTVLSTLGSPSAKSTFDPNVWFYISQNSNVVGYHSAHVTRRSVVAITFDKENEQVAKVDAYTLRDGRIVAFNGRETPTRGRELSIIEQLLGNVGRGGVLPQQEPSPGQRPNGG